MASILSYKDGRPVFTPIYIDEETGRPDPTRGPDGKPFGSPDEQPKSTKKTASKKTSAKKVSSSKEAAE